MVREDEGCHVTQLYMLCFCSYIGSSPGAMAWVYVLCSVKRGINQQYLKAFWSREKALQKLRDRNEKFGCHYRCTLDEKCIIIATRDPNQHRFTYEAGTGL